MSRPLARVREVGLAGLARRVRHRLRRDQVETARRRWHARYADPERAGAAPDDVAGVRRCAAAFRSDAPDRRSFFFAPHDAALRDAFATRHPLATASIRSEADAALAGDLSWVVPGGRADWHAALPDGGCWPCVASDAIGIDAAAPRGDVRLTWEIGRCTHVVRLAQAAWLTGRPGYADGVAALLDDFATANPPGLGVAWAHAQEVAIRAHAWLWALHLAGSLGRFDDAALERWTALLVVHAEYVAAHLADAPITHNHLVSEAAGLLILGVALPDLRRAAAWRRLGARVLWRELAKQVDGEGVHGEHSTHYHAFVLDSFVAALLLCERAGIAVPAGVRPQLAGMAQLVAVLLRADGTLPAIGDTDAGRAWRLGGDPLDRRDVLAAAAVACGRADWGAIAGDAPGAFWITGGRPVPGAGGALPSGRALQLRDAGIALARTDFTAGAEVVVLRAGATRFRPDVLRSHMHADALSVLWRIGAEDVLLDPGTYLYSESDGWRAWLRGTASHSCVVVDGCDQADVTRHRFGITGEQRSRWLSFAGDATHLTAAAEHPAGALPRVRRRLAWRAGGLLALCDDVVGTGAHRIESWFQLPAVTGAAQGDAALLRLPSGRALRVQVWGAVERLELRRPEGGAGPGWHSLRYGTRTAGAALRLDAGPRTLPARIVTVFQLGSDAREPAPVHFAATADGVRIEAERGSIEFDADRGLRIEGIA